jgi:transposase
VKALRDNIESFRNIVAEGVYAKSIRGHYYGVTATTRVFYEPGLAMTRVSELKRNVESKEENLARLSQLTKKEAIAYRKRFVIDLSKDGSFVYRRDRDKLYAMSVNFGYFRVLNSADLDSAEALRVYRRKDAIEKGFDDLKNFVEMRRLRTHNGETTEGKTFRAFIAMIVVSHIGVRLEDYMGRRSWSKERVIQEMEKIRIIPGVNGDRLANPLTKTQRLIIGERGLDEGDVEAYVSWA